MNFYGLETEGRDFVCSWKNPPEYYLEILQEEMGINTIRLPFSYQYIQEGRLEKLHHFMVETQKRNISVILDYHRTFSTHQGPVPEEGITRNDFILCWLRVVREVQIYDNVFGISVFNEVQRENTEYIQDMHRSVTEAIESEFPGRFYYFLGCSVWGTDCSDMNFWDLPYLNRTFIEIHLYQFSTDSNPFTWDVHMPTRIPAEKWFIGEVGFRNEIEAERIWAETFFDYLSFRNISNVCLWTIAHSRDTDGWWKDDCSTLNVDKVEITNRFWNGYWKTLA